MKKCAHCGREYLDETSLCPTDGQLHQVIPPMPLPDQAVARDRQRIIDGEHLKLLAIFHFVLGGLALCGLLFLFLHYLLMNTIFSNPDLWKSQPNITPPPKEILKIFIWFYLVFGFVLVTAGVLNLLSGRFLRRRRHRLFSLVIGGLNCLQIPFGTVLGVLTIIVLLRPSVREEYPD